MNLRFHISGVFDQRRFNRKSQIFKLFIREFFYTDKVDNNEEDTQISAAHEAF